jgi:hypothetical protein
MRHKPAAFLSAHPFRAVAAHNKSGEQVRLLFDAASVLESLRSYTSLMFYGDDGYSFTAVGIIKHFDSAKAITFETERDKFSKFQASRPKFDLVIDMEFAKGRKPDRYIGMTIVASGSEKGKFAGFRKEFRSHDPLVDWVEMITFTKDHPANYWPDNSSFHEFVHHIPGYRFVLDDEEAEVLVRNPDEAVAGPEQGVIIKDIDEPSI